jgi:endonuclease YncB( thermonuclease family)
MQAMMARDYPRSLVVGQVVRLTAVHPDKYDKRVDAYVQLPDGRDLGDALIAAGLARPYSGGIATAGAARLCGLPRPGDAPARNDIAAKEKPARSSDRPAGGIAAGSD